MLLSLQLTLLRYSQVGVQIKYSAAVVCQGGITDLSHSSPSVQKHHHALPNSNRSRIQMGRVEFHYPKYFRGKAFLAKMESSAGPSVFILLSGRTFAVTDSPVVESAIKTAEPCGSYQLSDSPYKDS